MTHRRSGNGDPGGYRGQRSRKGIPNKIGRIAKENITEVFNLLGGVDAMVKWAKRNRTEFYKLYARLIPTEIVGTLDIRDASELSDGELIAIATGSGPGTVVEAQSESGPHEFH